MAAKKEKKLNTDYSDSIFHFKHPHPLEISTVQRREARHYHDQCGMCPEILNPVSRAYACRGCSFFLHEHCAELQQSITHPFHPHPLHFDTDQPYATKRTCNVCSSQSGSNYSWYRCEEAACSFNMHLKCAMLKPADNFAIDDQVELLQNSHGHSLFVCDKPNASGFSCTRCGFEFGDDDMIYICLECKSMLDEPCAGHGTQIKHHPLHPQHSLYLVNYYMPPLDYHRTQVRLHPFHPPHTQPVVNHYTPPPYCCSFCGGGGRNGYFFKCSSCTFYLDIDCANLDVTTKICKTNDRQIQIQPVTHPHPLIQVEVIISMKRFKSSCFACGLRFEDPVYACLSCGILLHKSCADLPSEITSHVHPNHQLKLVENYSRNNKLSSCRVCMKSTGHFFYSCRQCEFGLDVKCARAALPLIMSEYHDHSLAYVDTQTQSFQCDLCIDLCRQYYFRCLHLNCNFNIHDHCFPSLPRSIKHDCHVHPLTFSVYPIKEVEDDDLEEGTEWYCYACEEQRAFGNPTYFCASCPFIAHVHCVITAILPYLHEEPPKLDVAIPRIGFGEELRTANSADKKAIDHLRQMDKEIMRFREEIDALRLKLKELQKRRDQHTSKGTTSRRKFLKERRDQFYKSL